MKGRHNNPRPGSKVYKALEQLYKVGGRANLLEWMRSVEWTGAIIAFELDVVASLIRTKNVYAGMGEGFNISNAGLELLGVAPDAPPRTPPVIVAPRYVPAPQPLSARNMTRLTLVRPGALDYQAIPSLMGGQRVAFASSIRTGEQ